ncbi:carbohydrate sulfotransferase 15-like [Haliotis cracherodii]|uniref:carbohydrate sulfotransferase 15-like n=1 Tax=Haliotis cracherodii TaxID=6455 RepID=UPI0039EB083C
MTRRYMWLKTFVALILVFVFVSTIRKIGPKVALWYGWWDEYPDTVSNFYTALSQTKNVVLSTRWRERMLEVSHINVAQAANMGLNLSQTLHSYAWSELDLVNFPEFAFLPNFKNPCWRESYIPPVTCYTDKPDIPSRHPTRSKLSLRCLPYFLIIGQPKCGTTDIYRRLNNHPDVTSPKMKESFWIERVRFRPKCSSINTYLDFLQQSANTIDRVFKKDTAGQVYHHVITGDGSVDMMWDNTFWPLLPGNEGCREPCVTNADMVHHLNPGASIIISLRNPIDRLYSDYLYESRWLHYQISREDFHQEVKREIQEFNTCLLTNSVRACTYNGSHENAYSSKVRLRLGIYSVHVADWLRVFPRHQVHVIKFEDYIQDIENHMKSLFRFLDLRDLTKSEMTLVLGLEPNNIRNVNAQHVGEMLLDTRQMLTDFYSRYNKELTELLNNRKYLWEK